MRTLLALLASLALTPAYAATLPIEGSYGCPAIDIALGDVPFSLRIYPDRLVDEGGTAFFQSVKSLEDSFLVSFRDGDTALIWVQPNDTLIVTFVDEHENQLYRCD